MDAEQDMNTKKDPDLFTPEPTGAEAEIASEPGQKPSQEKSVGSQASEPSDLPDTQTILSESLSSESKAHPYHYEILNEGNIPGSFYRDGAVSEAAIDEYLGQCWAREHTPIIPGVLISTK